MSDNIPSFQFPKLADIEVVSPQFKPYFFVVGHSWARRFAHSEVNFPITLRESFRFKFFYANNINNLIASIPALHEVGETPAIILVFTAGNDLYNRPNSLAQIKLEFINFDRLIKQHFPFTKLIYSQVEYRYPPQIRNFEPCLTKLNLFGRNSYRFNVWLNVKVRRAKLGHKLFILRGPNLLPRAECYYADGVHLNIVGYSKLTYLLDRFVQKIYSCRNIPVGLPPLLVYCASPDTCTNCNLNLYYPKDYSKVCPSVDN